MARKLAVVLMNLGGPLAREDIYPYLLNFFRDGNIIGAPRPIREILARYIAARRSKGAALEAYSALGGRSPLLDNTRAQQQALEAVLKKNIPQGFTAVRVFTTMRYWHPLSDETVAEVLDYNPAHVVLLPLYPQYSTATVKSSIEDWQRAAWDQDLDCDMTPVCCWPFQDGFIQASAGLIKTAYAAAKKKNPDMPYRLLFSAHGLPKRTIKKGDPYQWQCEESARKIAAATEIKMLDWEICYQSRVGPMKWIGPSTEEALEKAAKDRKAVLIYPHAFVSEHVETLVEIEEEYRAFAEEKGIRDFVRVETVGTHPRFIDGLREIVHFVTDQRPQPALYCGHARGRICPEKFKNCGYQILGVK